MSAAATEPKSPGPVKQGRLQEAMIVAAVLIMTLAAYVGTIWYNFVYDDDGQIVGNSYVQFWRHVPHYFISHVWAQEFPRAGGNYYRPLFLLWLRLNDAWFGLRPEGWHAAAIALHLLTTFLVYVLARNLTPRIEVAAFAAIIFGLHPMHAEVVAWISGATESLCGVFVIAAFLAYLKSRESNAAIWMTISCFLYAIAVFSKETAIVLPALVFGHYWIYARGAKAEAEHPVRRFMAGVRTVLVYVPVAAFYLVARVLVLRRMGYVLVHLSARQVIFSVPSMVGFYVKKWFLPIHLNEFYDMPYWGTLNFWHVILPALVVLALAGAIWAARNQLGRREVEFSLLWILLPLLPVLDSRMRPIDEMVHDRYFYLPSVGAALLVALAIDRVTRSRRRAMVFGLPAAPVVVALALAATLGVLTVRESQYWFSDYTLFQRGYQLAPLNPTGRLDYGVTLMSNGDYDGARAVFSKSFAADPSDWHTSMNLGRIDYDEHKYAEAERWFLQANGLNKDAPDVYTNLGMTDLRTGRLDDALVNMRKAVQLRPNDPTYLFAYGVVLEAKGNCSLASDEFRQLLDIRPGEGYAEIQLNRCQQILSHTSQN
jgi:tetratricopeptide (TPR) repeat protein